MNFREFPFVRNIWIMVSINAVVNGFITSGPLNAVAEVGGQAIFNCTSDTNLQNWILAKSRNDLGTPAVQNIAINCAIQTGFTVHYEVDRPGGSTNICNLIVKATTMQQAGIYTCSDTSYGPSAILTVIDPTPVLTRNSTSAQEAAVEGESVMFECMLNYNGSLAPAPTLRPYFYWTNSIGQNVTSYNDSSTDDLAFSQFTVTAQRGNDIAEYTCHVYFKLNLTTTSNYANNTPTVNSSATSLTIEVLYYPAITSLASTVSTTDNCVYKQETLTCTADANPPAQYEWRGLSNNVVTSGSEKYISSGGQYQCIAFNTIRGQRYNDTKIENLNTCSSPKNVTISGAGCANNSCSCSMNNTSLKLSCMANSIPEPNYIWWSDDPNNENPGSSATIDVEFDGNYSCTASNRYGNQNHLETVSIPVYNCIAHRTAFPSPTTKIQSTPVTSNDLCSCEQMTTTSTSNSAAISAAIALGVLFFIALVTNAILLILLIMNKRTKRDDYKRTGNILQPDTLDLSSETQTPTTYEELRRPTENNFQLVTYEELRHKPATDKKQ